MPSDKQKTVTVPLDVWENIASFYDENREILKRKLNIRSTTGLIIWVLRNWIYEDKDL